MLVVRKCLLGLEGPLTGRGGSGPLHLTLNHHLLYSLVILTLTIQGLVQHGDGLWQSEVAELV